jgi:hypothetical protein
MRRLFLLLGFASLLASPGLAQSRIEATDIQNHPFSVDFPGHDRLHLKIRSGDVRVVGVDQEKVSVELSGSNAYKAGDLKVRFERKDDGGHLRVRGGPQNGITITVRIPSKTDLHARVPFGEVVIEKVSGNQDVELHAGDLTVDVGDRDAYSRVDASVYSGEVDADVFGATKGGLFRSFRYDGPGAYRLHAHVGAGQLTLR